MRLNRFLRRTGAFGFMFLGLSGFLGCVDPENAGGGSTSDTALYAFDSAEAAGDRVLIWDDLQAFHDADALPATSRRISSDQFAKVRNLAWGGMTVDGNGNRLWLVSETGDVVRVDKLRSQSGSIPTTEAFSFKLGNSSDRLNGGKFSQASLDSSSGTLYVMETSDSEARIWVVALPQFIPEGFIVTPGTKLAVAGDKTGTGLAAAGDSVYAYFQDGNQIPVSTTDIFNGARLRKGTPGGFPALQVLIGPNAKLGKYGSLAVDSSNNRIYIARHNQDAQSVDAPISVFTLGQFGSNPNQAPERGTLGVPALNNLRVLAHPGNKDWLGALDATSGESPSNIIRTFRNPSLAAPVMKSKTLGATVKLKGLALDGNA